MLALKNNPLYSRSIPCFFAFITVLWLAFCCWLRFTSQRTESSSPLTSHINVQYTCTSHPARKTPEFSLGLASSLVRVHAGNQSSKIHPFRKHLRTAIALATQKMYCYKGNLKITIRLYCVIPPKMSSLMTTVQRNNHMLLNKLKNTSLRYHFCKVPISKNKCPGFWRNMSYKLMPQAWLHNRPIENW